MPHRCLKASTIGNIVNATSGIIIVSVATFSYKCEEVRVNLCLYSTRNLKCVASDTTQMSLSSVASREGPSWEQREVSISDQRPQYERNASWRIIWRKCLAVFAFNNWTAWSVAVCGKQFSWTSLVSISATSFPGAYSCTRSDLGDPSDVLITDTSNLWELGFSDRWYWLQISKLFC